MQVDSLKATTAGDSSLASKQELVIFTACSANYLTKALAMCQSAQQHNPGVDIVILLVDRKRQVTLADSRARLLWAEDLGFPDFLQCAFKYNIIELNTALKPFAALKLLEAYRKVIYLDPDVCVFSSFASVSHALDESHTVFTPHALSPYEGSGRPTDQDLLRFGAFNLGFFAARNTPQARDLLNWWHRQCSTLCYYEPQSGLGVDQKWIDLAPSFFEGVTILKDPGLNVAFWNLHERTLSTGATGWQVNGVSPLVFVHFSSFNEADVDVVAEKQTRHAPGTRSDFAALAQVYLAYLQAARNAATLDPAYGFATFDDGSVISAMLRRMYAIHAAERFPAGADPFAAAGPVHAFAKRHGLMSNAQANAPHQNFKVASAYKREQRYIATAFKFALFLLGPDRYFALMRYLGHYSSTLNQSDLLRR